MLHVSTKIISFYQAQQQEYKRYSMPEKYDLKFITF
jgi:hypothetical protein